MTGSTVTYVLPDKAGGVYTVVDNLLRFRRPDRNRHTALLVRSSRSSDEVSAGRLAVDAQDVIRHDLPAENLYAVMRRLRHAIPAGPGAIVANDWLELATASTYDLGKAVVNITHGDYDYYYNLAVRYADSIDLFIAHTRHIHETLVSLLPSRAADIRHIRYGVRIPSRVRTHAPNRLRILYVGRFDANKGVAGLPGVAAAVHAAGHDVEWTFIGDGPDRAAVMASWPSSVDATWHGQLSPSAALDAYPDHDVLILMSRHEGLPACVLEAGAAGVVPIVSDLRSGIPEVVADGVTGFRCAPDDPDAFARSIVRLDADRALLATMSARVRARVAREFDIVSQAPAYQTAIEHAIGRPVRARAYAGPRMGSRLDRWWLPNAMVRTIRQRRMP